jgi:NADPH:quinone reductase-like Zn-dependent oxidoreductase
MSLKGLKCPVSKFVNSDTCPRPTTQVLVKMLAAPMSDEDFLRVLTPLHDLNALPPFDQQGNRWKQQQLPSVAGCDGVGVVVATAKRGQSDGEVPGVVRHDRRPSPLHRTPTTACEYALTLGPAAQVRSDEEALEAKDWVVVKPDPREAPLGTWRGMLICHEHRLLKV